jgi:glutamate dehydrogenase
MPRELYTTWVRQEIQDLLVEATHAIDVEFDTYFSESILVRLQLTLRVNPDQDLLLDEQALEAEIVRLSQDWSLELARSIRLLAKEERERLAPYAISFSTAYRSVYDVSTGLADARRLASLTADRGVIAQLYRPDDYTDGRVRLKIYRDGPSLPLSTIVPILENLGFEVIAENPFDIERADRKQVIRDFDLVYPQRLDLVAIENLFEDAFIAVREARAENDSFNHLVLGARLDWQEVGLLRAYSRYLKQIRFGLSQAFFAQTLLQHSEIARALVDLFNARFDPQGSADCSVLEEQIVQALNNVNLFNEDKALRGLFRAICATVRTNYFQPQRGQADVIAFKIASGQIPDIVRPTPLFELFVYGVDVEGVHLRSSRVARGGIRWSDRLEDYRTEVLALMKTQVVKNAVIVPSGAKGGFVVKRNTHGWELSDVRREVNRAYRLFISALLDVTDNVVDGSIVPPDSVLCHDTEDPYLVVAADKGTATFSDDANALASQRGYWLGDAFASGGSNGYDHKKMGITAKGAWVCVVHHFRELGLDPQHDPLSIVGIGDLSGDVFGNGLLRSRSVRLVGAFNHQFIFLDPDPDAQVSFEERLRLFGMPGSSWSDYNPALISKGGGVYPRTQKTVPVSPEVAARLAIEAGDLAPDRLIRALLRAPVDLLWNGGIGTYVKASTEADDAAADPINDDLRVDASDLRCRVIGEGGNLGLTALARVEYALQGGSINTDFVDNAGGVDCSDHEVNIKILLDTAIAAGELAEAERNQVLSAVEDDVEDAVLQNNAKQAQALSLAVRYAAGHPEEFARFIRHLEREGVLNRKEDAIATEDLYAERISQNEYLTRPELAVLMSYAKIELKDGLEKAALDDDPAFARFAQNTFPGDLLDRFPRAAETHQLAGDIIRTRVANEFVDYLGLTSAHGIAESLGCSERELIEAYVSTTAILQLPQLRQDIEQAMVPATTQLSMLEELASFARRAIRWLVRRHRRELSPGFLIDRYSEPVEKALRRGIGSFLTNSQHAEHKRVVENLVVQGLDEHVAEASASARSLLVVFPVIDSAISQDVDVEDTAAAFALIGARLCLGQIVDEIAALSVTGHWAIMQRESLLEDLLDLHSQIVEDFLTCDGWDHWEKVNPGVADFFTKSVVEVGQSGGDLAHFAMTVRSLKDQVSAGRRR